MLVPYPKYITYAESDIEPSVLSQEFPLPNFSEHECYYPKNRLLDHIFESPGERATFAAANFCGFLADTIEVEHNLVIPAVAAIRRLPFQIPHQAELDLFKTATDEGYHAEQALAYLNDLRIRLGIKMQSDLKPPLFMQRLEEQRDAVKVPFHRDLITVLNGVVTETRISIELSRFAADSQLADSVRRICKTHAMDEKIHASQFRALGTWLWQSFDDETKTLSAKFYIASTIARSMPDLSRLIEYLGEAKGVGVIAATEMVCDSYTADDLIDEMLIAAKPTLHFLDQLGVTKLIDIDEALLVERQRQRNEMTARRHALMPR